MTKSSRNSRLSRSVSATSVGRILTLEAWINLRKHDGWLIVDEAFIDTRPEMSLASETGNSGLIVLRSFGKYFGLPGVRLGFVLAWSKLLQKLEDLNGPWAVNGPARYLGKSALTDDIWQGEATDWLKTNSSLLKNVLERAGLKISGSTDFFHWVTEPDCLEIHNALKDRAILTRYFKADNTMRFGLTRTAKELARLEEALCEI